MIEKLTSIHTFGISISADQIYFAHLDFKESTPVIQQLSSAALEEVPREEEDTPTEEESFEFFEEELSIEEEVKPLYIVSEGEIPPIAKHWLVVSGAQAKSILTRTFEVGLTKAADVEAVLSFQAEPLLPYALEEGVLDHIPITVSETGTLVTLVSIRKDHLHKHLQIMKGLQLEPEITSCSPSALATFSKYYSPNEDSTQPIFILHIDLEETIRVLATEGKLLAAHRFPIGLKNLVWALMQDRSIAPEDGYKNLSAIDFSKLDPSTYPNLSKAFENLKNEISKTLFALAKQKKAQQVEEILITGEGGVLKGLVQAIKESLSVKVVLPIPSGETSTEEMQKFAIPIGLALEALPNTSHQMNFRQEDFSYPHPWKRFKQPVSVYLALCLVASIAFYFLGDTWIDYKTSSVQKKYSEVLASLEKPYTQFETSFLKRTGISEPKDEDVILLSELSQNDLTNRLLFLQEEIRSAPTSYPLHPNIPRVSDVLAWLATHPQVRGEGSDPLLSLESLNYTMIKRPQKGKSRDKYQVKLELEFTTPIPKLARSFRDALMEVNPFVDSNSEIKWTSTRDRYKTSFLLKDKTLYP